MPDELIPTRILRSFGAYAPGEIAGFVEAKVREFENKGVVERVKVDPETGNVIEVESEVVEEAKLPTEAPGEVTAETKPPEATARSGSRQKQGG